MNAGAVLKLTPQREHSPARMLLRGYSPPSSQVSTEAGVWISDGELQALEQRCFEKGRTEGLAQGRHLVEESLRIPIERDAAARFERELKHHKDQLARQEAQRWRSLASTVDAGFTELRERLESEVTEWTFTAVVRLLGAASVQDVRAAIARVLEEAGLQEPLKVLLHRADFNRLRACEALSAPDWPRDVQFAADDRVSLGGCLVESKVQTLDARLEVQLALLRQALDAARARAADHKA